VDVDVPLERRWADGVNAIALMFKKRRLWRLNVWKWALTYGRLSAGRGAWPGRRSFCGLKTSK